MPAVQVAHKRYSSKKKVREHLASVLKPLAEKARESKRVVKCTNRFVRALLQEHHPWFTRSTAPIKPELVKSIEITHPTYSKEPIINLRVKPWLNLKRVPMQELFEDQNAVNEARTEIVLKAFEYYANLQKLEFLNQYCNEEERFAKDIQYRGMTLRELAEGFADEQQMKLHEMPVRNLLAQGKRATVVKPGKTVAKRKKKEDEKAKIVPTKEDKQGVWVLNDDKLDTAWYNYHRDFAVYEIIDKK